tara:strand:- start:237 stop:473 length:237 start_codon:yes stop_codon:yes gene_type:complete
MIIDAVIIDVEFQLESLYSEWGHYVCLKFIDESPNLKKLKGIIHEFSQFNDVKLVDYEYNIEIINEFSNLDGFDITKH